MFKKLKQRLEDSVDAATSAVTSASGGRINLQKSPESQPKVKRWPASRAVLSRVFTPEARGGGGGAPCHSFNHLQI